MITANAYHTLEERKVALYEMYYHDWNTDDMYIIFITYGLEDCLDFFHLDLDWYAQPDIFADVVRVFNYCIANDK